jgi:hypothetical protein
MARPTRSSKLRGKAAWDFFAGLMDSFLQGFRDTLGIASPSTIFADFGKWNIEVD